MCMLPECGSVDQKTYHSIKPGLRQSAMPHRQSFVRVRLHSFIVFVCMNATQIVVNCDRVFFFERWIDVCAALKINFTVEGLQNLKIQCRSRSIDDNLNAYFVPVCDAQPGSFGSWLVFAESCQRSTLITDLPFNLDPLTLGLIIHAPFNEVHDPLEPLLVL